VPDERLRAVYMFENYTKLSNRFEDLGDGPVVIPKRLNSSRAICTDILHFPARVLVTEEAWGAIARRT